jgi:hypothetical protein
VPNGRYADVGATQHRTPRSPTTDTVTTDAYFGNGAYTVEGNAITFRPDNGREATRGLFRLEQESPDHGRSWADRLCLLTEGKGEICYRRDR